MKPSMLRATALLAFVLTISLFAVALAIDLTGQNPNPQELGLAASAGMFAAVGFLIVRKHPRHLVGWILLGIGALGTTGAACEQVTEAVLVDGRELPGFIWAAWLGDWYWVPWLWGQFVFLPLLFPTGTVPGPRWRLHARVALASAGVTTLLGMFGGSLLLTGVQIGAGETEVIVLDNPVGFLPIENIESDPVMYWLLGMFALALLSVAAIVGRFRRAAGPERAQLKFAVYGLVVTVVGFVSFGSLDALGLPSWPGETLLLMVIPATLGLAVLRNRLYDIDRIISRTVTYTLATAVLVGVYLGSVVLAQTILRPVIAQSDLAVAGSTLVVAALFRPVLRRVQATVDRRFHRSRYDAQRTVATFGQRLRDDVDLGSLVADLGVTVREVVEPRAASVWVPAPEGGPK